MHFPSLPGKLLRILQNPMSMTVLLGGLRIEQISLSLSFFFFFCCIRMRLERARIPGPHIVSIWLAQGSAPLPRPHSPKTGMCSAFRTQHRLSPDCLQALDLRLAWPMFSQTPWSKAVPGEPRDAVFLCAWGVREQRGQWSRTSQLGAPKKRGPVGQPGPGWSVNE